PTQTAAVPQIAPPNSPPRRQTTAQTPRSPLHPRNSPTAAANERHADDRCREMPVEPWNVRLDSSSFALRLRFFRFRVFADGPDEVPVPNGDRFTPGISLRGRQRLEFQLVIGQFVAASRPVAHHGTRT